MKLSPTMLATTLAAHEVQAGNIYPAKGGRKSPGTEYWLVVATSNTVAHCIGFDKEGNPVSTTSYLKGAMRERPIIGRVDLSSIVLDAMREKGQ